MVTKSLTPNTAATPPAANTSAAKSLLWAASASLKLIDPASLMSSVNFIASGFGVGEGSALAMSRGYAVVTGLETAAVGLTAASPTHALSQRWMWMSENPAHSP